MIKQILPEEILIRETSNSDSMDIWEVEVQAFDSEEEARLVEDLIHDKSAEPALSLLAYCCNEAAGHILFTRCTISSSVNSPLSFILAPLAVKPSFQKKGIGTKLILEGLKRLKAKGAKLVFVLGHQTYYPRFGFQPNAEGLGFAPPFPIPEQDAEAWMVLALTTKNLDDYYGKVQCAYAMNKPEYWRE